MITMFKKRKGARYLKTLHPIDRLMPHVMPKRSDAQVFFTDDIDCTAIDKYIAEKKEQGVDMTYLDVFVAGAVRLYAKRPALNRFVMGGRIFAAQNSDEIFKNKNLCCQPPHPLPLATVFPARGTKKRSDSGSFFIG